MICLEVFQKQCCNKKVWQTITMFQFLALVFITVGHVHHIKVVNEKYLEKVPEILSCNSYLSQIGFF